MSSENPSHEEIWEEFWASVRVARGANGYMCPMHCAPKGCPYCMDTGMAWSDWLKEEQAKGGLILPHKEEDRIQSSKFYNDDDPMKQRLRVRTLPDDEDPALTQFSDFCLDHRWRPLEATMKRAKDKKSWIIDLMPNGYLWGTVPVSVDELAFPTVYGVAAFRTKRQRLVDRKVRSKAFPTHWLAQRYAMSVAEKYARAYVWCINRAWRPTKKRMKDQRTTEQQWCPYCAEWREFRRDRYERRDRECPACLKSTRLWPVKRAHAKQWQSCGWPLKLRE